MTVGISSSVLNMSENSDYQLFPNLTLNLKKCYCTSSKV